MEPSQRPQYPQTPADGDSTVDYTSKGQTYLARNLHSAPLITCSDCSCLTAGIQGDYLPPPSKQQGLGGISECQDVADYLLGSVLAHASPLPYPRRFYVRAVGFYL